MNKRKVHGIKLGLFILLYFAIHSFLYAQVPKTSLRDSLYLLNGLKTATETEAEKKLFETEMKMLEDSGIAFYALKQKSKAPDFNLKNSKSKEIKLSTELQKGPVVLVWYRGGWNPFCALTLRYLQAYLPQFKTYGTQIFALSAESPEKMTQTKLKNKLSFELLQDADNQTAAAYGLKYTLNDSLAGVYETHYKLKTHYGKQVNSFPLTAAYIIHPNGKIVYAFVDINYKNRVSPTDLLRVLKGMGFSPAPK